MGLETKLRALLRGTLVRELLVGLSGAMLVGFIAMHLAGNFLLFKGPEAYNAYASHLHAMGPILWVARVGLLAAFVLHVSLTVWLVLENRKARQTRYAVPMKPQESNFAKRTMIYTGLIALTFIVLHISDFALGDQAGPRSVMGNSGAAVSLGLYGVVWNSFADPVHAALYIIALCALGLHLSNAIMTIWITFGVLPGKAVPHVKRAAYLAGALFAGAFISIPVYVLASTYLLSCCR